MTRDRFLPFSTALLLPLILPVLQAQTAAPPASHADPVNVRLEVMSKLLVDTQRQLEETQRRLKEMRSEVDQLRAQTLAAPPAPAAPASEQVARQQEEQEVLQAEVKQHEQTKLESLSKYPVRVYGLVLFNAYSNAGLVDNPDLPSAALPRTPGASHGSIGGSFRQTLLGINANGPQIFGARSSADVSIDFFGGPSYNYYGSTNGSLRLRRGDLQLAWGSSADTGPSRDELHLGVDGPLISPLSPTSFATVALPALAWSGNLWTWAPEIRYQHSFALSSSQTFRLEGGLWDPPVVASTGDPAARTLSAGELSRRPGLLGRASIQSGSSEHPFALGIGGFSDRQTYNPGQQIQMWAVTADWQLPLTHLFALDGELYRGRGLGGLGGGSYKDVLTGIDLRTGLSRTLGLNAVGGWAQLKTIFSTGIEANLTFGQDGGFASDFHQLNLTGNTYTLEQSARTRMFLANFIYRPRTYLILSPEYRRLLSWKSYGTPSVANIYTLSLGYQF